MCAAGRGAQSEGALRGAGSVPSATGVRPPPHSELLVGASPRQDLGDGDQPFGVIAPEDRQSPTRRRYRPTVPTRRRTSPSGSRPRAARMRSRSVRPRRDSDLSAAGRSSMRQGGSLSQQLPGSLLQRNAWGRLLQCCLYRRLLLPGIGLVVPGTGIQRRHHGIPCTLEQTCRRVEGGLGQLVDEAVKLGSGHPPKPYHRWRGSTQEKPKGAVGVPTRSRAEGPIGLGLSVTPRKCTCHRHPPRRATGKLDHSEPISGRQGARRSTMVSAVGLTSTSIRTWCRACEGTRSSQNRLTAAMAI
jgi:hypothetical protein